MPLKRTHIPLYYQVEQVLREKITSGEISRDEPLPTEAELCRDFGVSRITVRQALTALKNDGLITRIPGKGTFITPKDPNTRLLHHFNTIEGLVNLPPGLKRKIHYRGPTSPGSNIASMMGLAPGQKSYCLRGVYLLEDVPAGYFMIHVPSEFASFFEGEDLSKKAVLSVVEEKSGLRVNRAQQTISASRADVGVARFLELEAGDPVLRFERIWYSENERVVEAAVSFMHFERYHYVLQFEHEK